MDIEKKICSKCFSEKFISDFYIKDIYKGKRRFDKICKFCRALNKSKKGVLCDSNLASSINENKGNSILKQMVEGNIALNEVELNDVVEVVLRLRSWHQSITADSI